MFPNNIANLSIPQVERLSIDWRVLAFTVLVAVVTAVAFGLVPAAHAIRTSLNQRTPCNRRPGSAAGCSLPRLR
jgi:hypothetical protein